MKKSLINYSICWVVFIALFNIICFVTPEELFGFYKFGGAFWAGYAFTILFLVIHYAFMYKLINSNNNSTVSNTLMVMSYVEVALMVIASVVCMLIPDLPNWASIVACSCVFALSIIIMVATNTTTSKTVNSYEAVNEKTKTMRELTAEAELLMKKTRGTEKEEMAKKIYEAIRYSNAISNNETMEIELQIKKDLSDVLDDSLSGDLVLEKYKHLMQLIDNRNKGFKEDINERNQ